jgi:2-polyprenyl-3-methyl-5-hydroxy-6-metoxy-1,4-benzoquinol methylase
MSDSEEFTSADAASAWNRGAEAWEEFVESGADYYRHEVHGPALLAAEGARVTGIDLAEAQIAHARRHAETQPLGVEYRCLDAGELSKHWSAGSFDLVTVCMALHDMADAEAVLAGAWQVLAPGGRLVFSIPHPGTDTRFREWERTPDGQKGPLKIDHYFETGPRVLTWGMARLKYHWDVPCWRRTLSEWSSLLAGAGFLIRRLHEPRPTPEQAARRPELRDAYRLPAFLIVDALQAAQRPIG